MSKNEAARKQSQGTENCSRSLQKCNKYLLLLSHSGRSKGLQKHRGRPEEARATPPAEPSRVAGGTAVPSGREQPTRQLSRFRCRNWSGDNVTTLTDTLHTRGRRARAPRSLGSGQAFPMLGDGRAVSPAVWRRPQRSPPGTSCPLPVKKIYRLRKATLDLHHS